jgi:hypothetical protein
MSALGVIWRFALPLIDAPTLHLPAGARVLSVGPARGPEMYSNDGLDVWALVDPTATREPRSFRVVGTGNPMPTDAGKFVGTVPSHGGSLIWHVFEAVSSPETGDDQS